MQANELRIGNWVKFITHDDDVFTEQITGKNIELIEYIEKYPNDPEERIRFQLRWEPIPLTPEILEQCGASVNNLEWNPDKSEYLMPINESTYLHIDIVKGYTYIGHYEKTVHVEDGVVDTCFSIADIRYLHQLQNLFHSLTNTELTWNRKQ